MSNSTARKVIVHPSQNSIAQIDSEGVVFTHDTFQLQVLDAHYNQDEPSLLIIEKMLEQFNSAVLKLKLREGRIRIGEYLVDDNIIRDTLCLVNRMIRGEAPADKVCNILRRLNRMAQRVPVVIETIGGRQIVVSRDTLRFKRHDTVVYTGSIENLEETLVTNILKEDDIIISTTRTAGTGRDIKLLHTTASVRCQFSDFWV